MDNEEAKEIASIIIQQMGGARRLKMMIGAANFSYGKDGELTFHFKGSRKANIFKVRLNSLDTYDLQFWKSGTKADKGIPEIRIPTVKMVHEINGIYNDQLKEIFEEFTGLYLTLGEITW